MLLLAVVMVIYLRTDNNTLRSTFLALTHSSVRGNFGKVHQHLGRAEKGHTGVAEETFNISRDFGLYVRMTATKGTDYLTMLVLSMKYFWFLPVDLTVVLDDTPQDRKFGAEIATKYPYPKICHEQKFHPKYYHNNGKALSELSNFYPDNCFNKTYVGIVDSDTFFVTPVTPELLFNGTKPHAICTFGDTLMQSWKKSTFVALHKKEVFKFMSYFPVTIKVEHLIEMREYMAHLHKKSFLEVFRQFSRGPTDFSQFSIMGNYLWYFHRDEYQFHAQHSPRGFTWNETQFRHSMDYYNMDVTDDMKKPFPASSMHYRHQFILSEGKPPKQIPPGGGKQCPEIIKPGICKAGGFKLCPDVCDSDKENHLHIELFKFEEQEWMWDTRCLGVQEEHYRNVVENYSEIIKPQILEGCEYLRKHHRFISMD